MSGINAPNNPKWNPADNTLPTTADIQRRNDESRIQTLEYQNELLLKENTAFRQAFTYAFTKKETSSIIARLKNQWCKQEQE